MRSPYLFPAALICTALAGQTAAPENLVQRFNTNLPAVNQLLNDLKFQEAIEKAQGLVPAQAPVFDPKDPATIGMSLENGRGMMALMKLHASCVTAQGQWEKAVELNQARVDYARLLRTNSTKALGDLNAQWSKVVEEGNAYIAQNEPKAAELEKKIATLQQDIKNHNEKKVTLDKKQIEELQARAKQAPMDEQSMLEIKARVSAYKDAQGRFKQFSGWVQENQNQVDGVLKEAEEALEKSKGTVKAQGDEIAKFNADMLKKDKKFKAEGSKKWVEAVMRDKTNLTKLETPRVQAQLLSRLALLSPGDKAVEKALANLKAGRDPFFVEKPSKSKKAAK